MSRFWIGPALAAGIVACAAASARADTVVTLAGNLAIQTRAYSTNDSTGVTELIVNGGSLQLNAYATELDSNGNPVAPAAEAHSFALLGDPVPVDGVSYTPGLYRALAGPIGTNLPPGFFVNPTQGIVFADDFGSTTGAGTMAADTSAALFGTVSLAPGQSVEILAQTTAQSVPGAPAIVQLTGASEVTGSTASYTVTFDTSATLLAFLLMTTGGTDTVGSLEILGPNGFDQATSSWFVQGSYSQSLSLDVGPGTYTIQANSSSPGSTDIYGNTHSTEFLAFGGRVTAPADDGTGPPVPEPGSLALAAAGIAAFATRRRRG